MAEGSGRGGGLAAVVMVDGGGDGGYCHSAKRRKERRICGSKDRRGRGNLGRSPGAEGKDGMVVF